MRHRTSCALGAGDKPKRRPCRSVPQFQFRIVKDAAPHLRGALVAMTRQQTLDERNLTTAMSVGQRPALLGQCIGERRVPHGQALAIERLQLPIANRLDCQDAGWSMRKGIGSRFGAAARRGRQHVQQE